MSNVDMVTLKSLVVELKDSGMTFQEVADTLEKKYSVVRSRQALYGIYKRAKESFKDDEKYWITVCDVVNIACITDSYIQAVEKLQQIGVSLSYRQLLSIVNKETEYVKSVERTITANIEAQLENLKDIREAVKSIEYKGIGISEKRFEGYLMDACEHHIRMGIVEELSKMYRLTSNKSMVKQIGQKFNLDIKTADLNLLNE